MSGDALLAAWQRGGWLRSVDHALAQSMRRLRPDTPEPVLLAAALASRALAFGHAGVVVAQLDELAREIDPLLDLPPLPAADALRAALFASPWVATPAAPEADRVLAFENDRLYLRRYWDYERRLATALRRIAAGEGDAAFALPAAGGPQPDLFAAPAADDDGWLRARLAALFPDGDAQAVAAALAQRRHLLLVTGGPGTGKTSTVAGVLALLVEDALRRAAPPLRIRLAAPTGKAASRLAEALHRGVERMAGLLPEGVRAAIPAEAQTLHRLLGWRPDGYRHGADAPLEADLVVVDEASMVDLPMMCRLAEAIPDGARLILLGDRDQLPSVETGDVLAALCDAAGGGDAQPPAPAAWLAARAGLAVPVTAPRTVLDGHRVQLARVHRQDAAIELAPLAAHVRAGEAEAAVAGLAEARWRGLRWERGGDRALPGLLRERALPAYRRIAEAPDPRAALQRALAFRVLTAVREGPAGSVALNAQIEAALAPRGGAFYPGRLLMITANSYRHGLYNGDIGVCWPDPDGGLSVWFETGPDTLAHWRPSNLPAHEPAFAMTVHKSQGSEFAEVLLVLPERGARVIGRELVYTGITRCRSALLLCADEDVLRAGIARRTQRGSGLAERFGIGS
ncbi:exodeoxyribonuclease V subunit alpha [Coralloluteibacterium thermophilus]|uniref:RecBCD enzyme subunit RecD n=1 Tax=Coralloluteibacterium thermophilum TaxID=2707049 RepID=A0ABV9NNG1_9GAMM